MRTLSLIAAAASCALAACGPEDDVADAPTGLTLLAVDSAPSLEIGRLEGEASYTFDNIVSVVTLP